MKRRDNLLFGQSFIIRYEQLRIVSIKRGAPKC